MNTLKNIFLLSLLSIGVCNAGTVPCNGFKIDFKNKSNQNLILDSVHFSGGHISTMDSNTLEVNNDLLYTVNQSTEGGVMVSEFLFHTANEPHKELKLSFSLTNKNLVCEVGNISKEGTLNSSVNRWLGGVVVPIKD